MKYTNEQVRRQDRLLKENEALDLLRTGEYGVLSMQTVDGNSYGVPINYVWDRKHSIYLHCAPEGHKLQCIKHCNRVSFCVVGDTFVISSKFTTKYESIILDCTAHIQLTSEEKIKALELLLDKYSPNDQKTGMIYAEKSFYRTEIIRLDILEWSGKSKQIRQDNL